MVKSFYSVFDLFVGETLDKRGEKLLRGMPGMNSLSLTRGRYEKDF